MKKISLLLICLLCLSLACTQDKNPVAVDEIKLNPDGKTMFDMYQHIYLSSEGELWYWGSELNVQYHFMEKTDGYINPTQLNASNPIIDFDMANGMRVAVDSKGNIWTWGINIYNNTNWHPPLPEPWIIAKLPDVIKVDYRGYLLKQDGSVWKIDIDSRNTEQLLTPVQVTGLNNIKEISGYIALKNNGNLTSLLENQYPPENGGILPLDNVSQVQSAYNHTVVLKEDGTVWSWGNNESGELGDGTNINSAEPVQVAGLDHVVQISTNSRFNLALKQDGSVWFWGYTGTDYATNEDTGVFTPERIETNGSVAYVHANQNCMFIQKDGTLWTFNVKDRVAQEIVL